MKLNWGNALIIFFTFYVCGLGFILYKSTQMDHTLVMEDYYAHDLAYQSRYDNIKNRELLASDLKIALDASQSSLKLDFGQDSNNVSGLVKFYSPVNSRRDAQKPFQLTSGHEIKIDIKDLVPGKYKAQVEWSDNKRTYYKEESIFIQI